MNLQSSLFRHLGKDYLTLILIIETLWKNETTSLTNIILQAIKHAEINKKNNHDNAEVKIMAADIY